MAMPCVPVDIEGGTLGRFTLEYPALLDGAQNPVQKLAGKTIAGNTATLKYDGGAQIFATLTDGGKITIKVSGAVEKIKQITVEMKVAIAFSQGGKWKIGATEGEFPKEKPAKPHLHQSNANTFQISNYESKTLTLTLPEHSFVQLTDNREWNWAVFNMKAVLPFSSEFTLNLKAAGGGKPQPLLDTLGQSTRESWPGKMKDLAELKADVDSEKAYYDALTPPKLNTFGGLPGSKEKLGLQATGFFHVEKKNNRWLLVDPSGDAFFHLGVCTMSPGEDFTLIKGRETAYEWLPARESEFKTAFRKEDDGNVFSFHLANMIRKYGKPYENEEYVARMIPRLRKWGFNSVGAFSFGGEQARKDAQFPYVTTLPIGYWEGVPRIPGIHEVFDPFDDKTRAKIEENLAKHLPGRANDPLLIGYFIVNEPIYENIPRVIPALNGKHACKVKFVAWLEQKYKTIEAYNKGWGSTAKNFAELNDAVLVVNADAAKADVQTFTGVFLEEYFKLVAENFRKHDKNHLLIGCRLQPGTINNEQLCRIMGKHLDIMSFNYYTYATDTEFLKRIYEWTGGRPMMLSEFYWSASKESGLNGGLDIEGQKERGLAYRNYVEQSAALDFVIGIEWFTLVDQSATGRFFEGVNGERANTGLLSVTDRPWKVMLDEMMKTNYEIYKVWFKERAPFEFDHPKFKKK